MGLNAKFNNLCRTVGAYFSKNGDSGAFFDTCELLCEMSAFEDNCRLNFDPVGGDIFNEFHAQLRMKSCQLSGLIHCHFEEFNRTIETTMAAGQTVTGNGILAATTVDFVNTNWQTFNVTGGGIDPAVVPAGTSLFSNLTVNGVLYRGCILNGDSPTVIYGNYSKHALNVEACPCFTPIQCTFGNAEETNDGSGPTKAGAPIVPQVAIYLYDNGSGTVAAPNPLHHLIGPQRMSKVKDAIIVSATGHRVGVYDPFLSPATTGTVTVPSGSFNVIGRR